MAAESDEKAEVSELIQETTSAYNQYEMATELERKYRAESEKWAALADAEAEKAQQAWSQVEQKAEDLSDRIQLRRALEVPSVIDEPAPDLPVKGRN